MVESLTQTIFWMPLAAAAMLCLVGVYREIGGDQV